MVYRYRGDEGEGRPLLAEAERAPDDLYLVFNSKSLTAKMVEYQNAPLPSDSDSIPIQKMSTLSVSRANHGSWPAEFHSFDS